MARYYFKVQFAHQHQQAHLLPSAGQISDLPSGAAMEARSGRATERAAGLQLCGNRGDGEHAIEPSIPLTSNASGKASAVCTFMLVYDPSTRGIVTPVERASDEST